MKHPTEIEKKGFLFWLGVVLVGVSFAIYPFYPVIAVSPLSATEKLAGTIAGSAMSWSVFLIGTALAGKEGVDLLRTWLSRRERRAGRQADSRP